MMRQKKIRSLKMSYAKQQEIYRTCQRYNYQPEYIKSKIQLIIAEVAKSEDDRRALFCVLTQPRSVRHIAAEHYMSERKLYALRDVFYKKY